MLTGQELLARVKEMGDAPKTELATACGYVSKKKDGSDRVNFTAFYEALLNAKGIDLGSSAGKGVGKGGRKLSYTAKVTIGGKIAQLGSRLIAGTAKKLSGKFFDKFGEVVAEQVVQ